MNFGTVAYDNKIYNLDFMSSDEIKELSKIVESDKNVEISKEKSNLKAILDCAFHQKKSQEIINTKVNNQIHSIQSSISDINSKFDEKSKYYDKVKSQIMELIDEYENNLKLFCDFTDNQINQLILRKFELEIQLLSIANSKENKKVIVKNSIVQNINKIMTKIKTKTCKNQQVDTNLINKVQDSQDIQKELKVAQEPKNITNIKGEIAKLTQQINDLNDKKVSKIFDAMEVR